MIILQILPYVLMNRKVLYYNLDVLMILFLNNQVELSNLPLYFIQPNFPLHIQTKYQVQINQNQVLVIKLIPPIKIFPNDNHYNNHQEHVLHLTQLNLQLPNDSSKFLIFHLQNQLLLILQNKLHLKGSIYLTLYYELCMQNQSLHLE